MIPKGEKNPVIVVDDDRLDVQNLERAFSRLDIRNPMIHFYDGASAFEYLKTAFAKGDEPLPRIVILDLNMPRMSGIDFLKAIRAHDKTRHLQVFVLTTSAREGDVIHAHSLNVAGYLVKPLGSEEFIHMMRVLRDFWEMCEFV